VRRLTFYTISSNIFFYEKKSLFPGGKKIKELEKQLEQLKAEVEELKKK
jgi:hypothetical protein